MTHLALGAQQSHALFMGKVVNIKKASGRSLSEDERETGRLTLRLMPSYLKKLDDLAERWGCSRTEVIATLIVNEHGKS